MQKKKNTIFLKKESQISNYKGKNSQILDERETFLRTVELLIQNEKLEDSLLQLFTFLKEFLPITYLLYTPPYESQSIDHIYITEEGVRFFEN